MKHSTKTSSPGITEQQQAFYSRALFLNDQWNSYAEYSDIDDNFNAEVGFVPRTGIRTTTLHLEHNPRPGGIVRVMRPMLNVRYTTDQHNRLVTRRVHHMVGTFSQDGTYVNVVLNRMLEVLDQPFAIQRDVTIPVGTYRFYNWNFTYNSPSSRRFYQRVTYSPQTFYSGTRSDLNLTFGLRATNSASAESSRCGATTSICRVARSS
jgi:hypothetical protein